MSWTISTTCRLAGGDVARQDQTGVVIPRRKRQRPHAAAIYRKLDVNSRIQAVARARELGIIP